MEHLLLNHSEIIHILLETFIALGTVGTLVVMIMALFKDKSKLYASLYATNDCGTFEEEIVTLKIVNKTSNNYTIHKDYAFRYKISFLNISSSLPLCPFGVNFKTLIGEYNYQLSPFDTTLMDLGNKREFCLDILELCHVKSYLKAVLLIMFMSFTLTTLSEDNLAVSVDAKLRIKLIRTWKDLHSKKTEETTVNV